MVSFNLTSGRFPEGTVVEVYPGVGVMRSGPPSGALVDTATMTNDPTRGYARATFQSLEPDTLYFAYALVGSEHRYVQFSTPPRGSA